ERERSSGPSTSNSVARDRSWPTMSGKRAWRAGKKGVRRMQRDMPALYVCSEVSLVSAAPRVDGAWGTEDSAGVLLLRPVPAEFPPDRKSTRLNSSHVSISYAVFCLKKKKKKINKYLKKTK